jgi:hypothetical protein
VPVEAVAPAPVEGRPHRQSVEQRIDELAAEVEKLRLQFEEFKKQFE